MENLGAFRRFANPLLLNLQKLELELTCAICLKLLQVPMLLPCNHMYCRSCITTTMTNTHDCPVCKTPFSEQDLRAALHIEPITHICKNMTSTVNAVLKQGPQSAISDTKMHSDATQDSGNNNLAEKFEGQRINGMEKQRPSHVKSCATLFGCLSAVETKHLEEPHEHKLNASEKVSEEVEINRFLAPSDTCSSQTSGYQKDSDNDSIYGQSEPTTSQLPATVFSKRAADNETSPREIGFLVKSKKQKLHKDNDCIPEQLVVNCEFCHTSVATEGSGPMSHYLHGEPMTDEQASQPNVLHVHQKCTEWAPQVYFVGDTAMNLEAELSRASKIKCSVCGLKGAALGCYNKRCRRCYHVPCADQLSECRWDYENFHLLCPMHSSHRLPCDGSKEKKKTSENTTLCHSTPEMDQSPCVKHSAEAWTASPCVTREWVLCGSALSRQEKNILVEFVTLSGASTSSVWNSSITHVIAATDEHGACSRTLKVLMAILGGKWILRVEWLKVCMEAGHPVAEEPFEISHDINGSFDGPRSGRLRAYQKAPKLFGSLSFYFNGYFMPNYKKHLETLISAAGGRLLERSEVVPITLIVYNAEPPQGSDPNDLNGVVKKRREEAEGFAAKTSSRVIPHTWLLDAIASCHLPQVV
ncbi:LOW QUALITY PROTEIN: BRCA1-associated RING domain protein 1-like [Curcuma longa]|uniref:LOW QUALITY PROTEIN: BRCA1-associated RING domain protein 1-like n=1 Tax=Curcuma longa TaxID=136217 RepID=UPI003D9FA281